MKRAIMTGACIVATISVAAGQARVGVHGPWLVSADVPSAQFVETTIAANPADSRNLVAAAMILHDSSTSVAVYSTRDGGRTWTPGPAPIGDASRADALDPWVVFTRDGAALFTYLSGRAGNNFAVSRSEDGGRTWSVPVFVPGGLYDRQYLVEGDNGRVYGLGKVNVSRLAGPPFQVIAVSESTDGARTFSPPRFFAPPDDNDALMVVAGGVTTRPGSLVVPFTTVIRPKAGDAVLRYTLWTTESNDGGRAFSAPHLVAHRDVPKAAAQRFMSVPSVAVDRSGGRTAGHVYLAWTLASGDGYAVQAWRSEDGGTTWQPGVTVNDNQRPAGHVNPAIAVNSRGQVTVAWYDRRDDPEGRCHRLHVAASTDAAETFSGNAPVAQAGTCVASTRFANVGDTLGLTADVDGRFHTVFVSGPNASAMQLHAATFDVDGRSSR
jgi:hypothetical protein